MKGKVILYTCTLLISGVFSSLQAQRDFYGMNCGSPIDYTHPQGGVFLADREYTAANGFGYAGLNSWQGQIDRIIYGEEGMDSLYFFRREGEFSYLFDVSPDTYAVNLYMSESIYHWRDFRVFYICIEGNTLIQDLDIYDFVGRKYAIPLGFLVECSDGQLNVDFIIDTCIATLSGISVYPITRDLNAPPQIQGFNTIGGYEMNILYWDYCPENDLAGYRVFRRQTGEQWQLLTPEIHPLYRYFDYEVETEVEYEYMVTAEDLWGNASTPSDSLTATAIPHEGTQLPRYIMEITEENLWLLNLDVWSEEYVDADLTLEGEYFPDSGVRYRGHSSRLLYKKSYKLKLSPGETHNIRDGFHLQADGRYPSMLPSRLGYQTYDLLNIINPMTQNIYLQRNDEYIGVYLDTEQVDNHFLERNGLSPGGNLYQAVSDLSVLGSYEEYQFNYPKKNNEESDWYDLINFIEWLNGTTPAEFRQEVGGQCDLDGFTDNYVVRIATADEDFSIWNYFMYTNPADGRWIFIAWDHDMTFDINHVYYPIDYGSITNPIGTGLGEYWNRLLNKVLEDSLFRYAYCKKLERFLNGGFTIQECLDRIETAHQEIYEDAIRDVYKKGRERPDLFINSIDNLNSFALERVPFLLGEISSYITNPELAPYFRLNEIQSDNQTTIADEAGDYDPWIEITNLAPVELDVEDFILHCGSNSWTLPAEAIVDDYGFLVIWLDGEPGEGPLHASFALSPGEGSLWLEGRSGALADTVAFPALGSDRVWARDIDGVGTWTAHLTPTPGSTNNPPQDPSELVVNEFLAINDSVNQDSAGDYDDWMEIYNPTVDTIPLGGLYLTDDFTRPTRWAFPDTIILPDSFVVVWCDNEPVEGPMHATFKLSGDGEQAGLYRRDGVTPIDTLTFGPQQADISFGRYPDGSEDWIQADPTPGGPNTNVAVSGDAGHPSIPREYSLEPNFPNPFNPTTVIRIALPRSAQVHLDIYNILGQDVVKLIDAKLEAGYHCAVFDASGLASGIYLFRMEADDFVSTRKMLLLK